MRFLRAEVAANVAEKAENDAQRELQADYSDKWAGDRYNRAAKEHIDALGKTIEARRALAPSVGELLNSHRDVVAALGSVGLDPETVLYLEGVISASK